MSRLGLVLPIVAFVGFVSVGDEVFGQGGGAKVENVHRTKVLIPPGPGDNCQFPGGKIEDFETGAVGWTEFNWEIANDGDCSAQTKMESPTNVPQNCVPNMGAFGFLLSPRFDLTGEEPCLALDYKFLKDSFGGAGDTMTIGIIEADGPASLTLLHEGTLDDTGTLTNALEGISNTAFWLAIGDIQVFSTYVLNGTGDDTYYIMADNYCVKDCAIAPATAPPNPCSNLILAADKFSPNLKSDDLGSFNLSLRNAPANAPTILIAGSQSLDQKLGNPCSTISVNPEIVLLGNQTDWKVPFALGDASLLGQKFWFQAISVDSIEAGNITSTPPIYINFLDR